MAGTISSSTLHKGVVTEFDEDRARGSLKTDDGASYGFHAIAFADSSRTVEVGQAVVFKLIPRPGGVWEGTDIVKL